MQIKLGLTVGVAAVRPRDRAGLMNHLLVLVRRIDVGVARDENVDVQPTRKNRQALAIAPRYDLMAVAYSYFKLSNRHDLFLWQTIYLVHISTRDVHVWCQRAQKIVLLSRAQISRANNMLHLIWNEHFSKFFVYRRRAVGHMQIPEDKDELAVAHIFKSYINIIKTNDDLKQKIRQTSCVFQQ